MKINIIMRYHLHHPESYSNLLSHDFYYYPGSFTWQLWQIVSLILGLLFVCFLIGICLVCLRRSGLLPGGGYGTVIGQPAGRVFI